MKYSNEFTSTSHHSPSCRQNSNDIQIAPRISLFLSEKFPKHDTNTSDFSASFFPIFSLSSLCISIYIISIYFRYIRVFSFFSFILLRRTMYHKLHCYIFNSSRRNANFDILSIKTHKLSGYFRSPAAADYFAAVRRISIVPFTSDRLRTRVRQGPRANRIYEAAALERTSERLRLV